MTQAYFDESGIHRGAPVCVVAGFYGAQDSWRPFEKEWTQILDLNGLREHGFRAKDFFDRVSGKRVGVYRDWCDKQATEFIEALVEVIVRNEIFPIGYAVVVEDFLAMPLVSRRWLTGAKFRRPDGKYISGGCPSKSYYLPFQFSVLRAAQLSGASPEEKIHFFAGIDRAVHKYASELYRFLLQDERLDDSLRSLLGTIAYPRSKNTPGIQAADLLAYRIYRGAKDKLTSPNYIPSALLLKLFQKWKGTRLEFPLMNRTWLERMDSEGERLMKAGLSPET